jgi:MFS family permease
MRLIALPRPRARPFHLARPYYGWVLVFALSLTELTSWGVLYYSFTVFIEPMQRDLGWSRGTLSGAFSLALLISGLAGLAIGRWLDCHGPRALMTAGSCLTVALVLCWAAVRSLLVFYLLWAALGVAMAAVLYDPAFWVVAAWFSRGRARALTVLTFMAGFASVIYIPLAEYLVQRQGWRAALVTLAVILALTTIPPHALLLRRRPEDLGLYQDGAATPPVAVHEQAGVPVAAALREHAFWWLTVAFFLQALGSAALFVHLVPYLTDRGFSAGFAASAAGLVGIAALPGRVLFTPLGERLPRGSITAFLFVLQALGIAALLLISGRAGVGAFVALFGASFGAITPARAALVADYYGVRHYGTIAAVVGMFVVVGRGIAPVAAGIAHDRLGSYTAAFWAMVALALMAAGAALLAERGAHQRRTSTIASE